MSLNYPIVLHAICDISKLYQVYETLSTNPSIHLYIDKINSRLIFKINDVLTLHLPIPGTNKLFSNIE